MSEPSSSGVKEDGNVTLEYNTTNVKKAKLNSTLAALLDDPLLADVPRKPTLSDVDTFISLELGSAMRATVLKLDQTSFDVALMNSATVKDLKLAVKKKVEMEQSEWVIATFHDFSLAISLIRVFLHVTYFVLPELWVKRDNLYVRIKTGSMCGEISVSHTIMKAS